jgi:hypothetical protein
MNKEQEDAWLEKLELKAKQLREAKRGLREKPTFGDCRNKDLGCKHQITKLGTTQCFYCWAHDNPEKVPVW